MTSAQIGFAPLANSGKLPLQQGILPTRSILTAGD